VEERIMDELRDRDEEIAAKITYECQCGDTEVAHSRADEILCELLRSLGYDRTVNAWDAVDKWYA
jgi:hypothetical protein